MNAHLRDSLIPLSLGLGALLFVCTVVILAHSGDFVRDVADPEVMDTDSIETILQHAFQADVHQSLAGILTVSRNERPLARATRRAAYVVLSNATLTRSKAAIAFASNAPVRFASGHTAIGFEAASHKLFGLSAKRLSIGEMALLCRTAITGRPPPTPDDALLLRNQLIGRLGQRGVLSSADIERELARPFTLAPDPSPIY